MRHSEESMGLLNTSGKAALGQTLPSHWSGQRSAIRYEAEEAGSIADIGLKGRLAFWKAAMSRVGVRWLHPAFEAAAVGAVDGAEVK